MKTDDPNLIVTTGVANYIYDYKRDTTGKAVISPDADWYLPAWQVSSNSYFTMNLKFVKLIGFMLFLNDKNRRHRQ